MNELKIACYISMIEKLKRLSLSSPIEENPFLRGNLSFFVDQYFEDDHWDELLQRFHMLADEGNVNELCMMLMYYIYYKVVSMHKNEESVSSIIRLCFQWGRDMYEDKELNTFVIVSKKYYPDWLYQAEIILGFNH